ncbi:MAG: cation transporter [Euryarchaeota archaeon]|nr:cation transporter [Euryarchaeota archaeon]
MREAELSAKELRFALTFTLGIFVAEVIGGVVSNSLALLSDALHVFSDAFALALSYFAIKIASRPPSLSRTFGYHRAEVLAALANGLLLLLISLAIFHEAYQRFVSPPEIKLREMLAVAVLGLGANLFVMYRLREHAHEDINVRGAFLHVVGDTLGSVGVIAGGVAIYLTGNTIADPAVSALIATIVAIGALRLVAESLHILLEGTPRHVDVLALKRSLESIAGVEDVHDLHVWAICSHINAASAHIAVEDQMISQLEEIRRQVDEKFREYRINHTTLQFECVGERCRRDEGHGNI